MAEHLVRREIKQGFRLLGISAYLEWDAAVFPRERQGVSLLQNYISRLGQARMVQCGPDGYRSTLKRREKWDERPP
jgi:hypothetical protein